MNIRATLITPIVLSPKATLITHLLSSQRDVSRVIKSISVKHSERASPGVEPLIVFAFFQMVTKRNSH